MKILAIESSCDETAAAIVQDGVTELCSTVASSKELHERTGGIVPEVAARKQVEFVVPVIDDTLSQFRELGFSISDLDSLAVTVGPGLVGSLVVGVEAAKALALAWNKPLIPVNHLVGHVYANFVGNDTPIEFPAVVLLVSGGHTDLVLMKSHGNFEYLGGTLDDAAGEAFDKTARLLGLAQYLGGVQLSKAAEQCSSSTFSGRLPRAMMHDNAYDFSFSGLKTAVKRLIESEAVSNVPLAVNDIAKEFEDAVVDVLSLKAINACKNYGAKHLLLGGGVSANKALRSRLEKMADSNGVIMHVPPIRLCTDNAVYIASAAYFNNSPKELSQIHADPSLGIMDRV